MKRLVPFLALLAAGCAPDPMIGTYSFTITGGLDTQSNGSTSTPSGTGSLVITAGKNDAYLITVAHSDVGGCTLRGTKKKQPEDMTFDLVANQPCVLRNGSNQVTANITSGAVTLTITQVSQNDQRRDIVMPIAYSYTGSVLGFAFSGTGNRTYAGPEM